MHYEWKYESESIYCLAVPGQDLVRSCVDLPRGLYTVTQTYVVDHAGGRMPLAFAPAHTGVIYGFSVKVVAGGDRP